VVAGELVGAVAFDGEAGLRLRVDLDLVVQRQREAEAVESGAEVRDRRGDALVKLQR